MTVTTAGNLTGIAGVVAKWADNDADPYDRATQLYALARYLNEHTHKADSTMGAPVPGAVANPNRLFNGGMELWGQGVGAITTGTAAERWVVFASGTDTFSVTKDTTNNDTPGKTCMAAVFTLGNGAGVSRIYQNLNVVDNQLQNQTVSLSVRVKCGTANAVRVSIDSQNPSDNFVYSNYHTGDGTYQTLTVTAPWVTNSTLIQVNVHFAASATAYIDNAMLIIGSTSVNYTPIHLADELNRIAFESTSSGTALAEPKLNFLTNPGFEIWQRGNGPFTGSGIYNSDRWLSFLGGSSTLSVSRDSTNNDVASQYCAALTYTHNVVSQFYQQFATAAEPYGIYQLRGKVVTFSMRVKTSTANAVRLSVNDGTVVYGAYHTGDGTYQTLSVTKLWATNSNSGQARLELEASATIYVDNAVLVVSPFPVDYMPLHPADEWSRCQRYYQRFTGQVAGTVIAIGQNFSTTQAYFVIPTARMGGAPALTASAAADWGISPATGGQTACSSLATEAANAGIWGQPITAVVASGQVAGNATYLSSITSGAWLAFEWNP